MLNSCRNCLIHFSRRTSDVSPVPKKLLRAVHERVRRASPPGDVSPGRVPERQEGGRPLRAGPVRRKHRSQNVRIRWNSKTDAE